MSDWRYSFLCTLSSLLVQLSPVELQNGPGYYIQIRAQFDYDSFLHMLTDQRLGREFYELPLDEKLKYHNLEDLRKGEYNGYRPAGLRQ